jgi:hypothetical protein
MISAGEAIVLSSLVTPDTTWNCACGDRLGAALSGDELSRPAIGSFLTRYRVSSTRINAPASRVPRLERLGL